MTVTNDVPDPEILVRGRGFEPLNSCETEFLTRGMSLKSCAFGQLGYPRMMPVYAQPSLKTYPSAPL